MARPKTKQELLAGLSEDAKLLQGIQESAGSDQFNTLLGHLRREENSPNYNPAAFKEQNTILDKFWDQGRNQEGYNRAYDELARYNDAVLRAPDQSETENSLTTGALGFLTGKGTNRFFETRIKQIGEMKQSALAAVSNQIHAGYARQAQNLQDTHRRYGITGAVAEAQLQDLSLKKNQQLAELQAKTSIEFDKQFESEMTSLNAMRTRNLEAEKTSILNSLTKGTIQNVESLKDLLKSRGIAQSMSDEDINSLWENKDKLENIIKGNLL